MIDGSFEQQFQMSYEDVLRLARRRLASYRSPVSTTTLAHELYLNLHQRDDLNFATREQFLPQLVHAFDDQVADVRVIAELARGLLARTFAEHDGVGVAAEDRKSVV